MIYNPANEYLEKALRLESLIEDQRRMHRMELVDFMAEQQLQGVAAASRMSLKGLEGLKEQYRKHFLDLPESEFERELRRFGLDIGPRLRW